MGVKKQFMCIYLMTWASFHVLIVFFLSCLEKDLFKSVTHVVGDMPWWACRSHRTVLWGWFLPSTTRVPGSELRLSDLCNKWFTLLLSHLSSSSYPVFHLGSLFLCYRVNPSIYPSGYKYLIRDMIYKYILTIFGLYFHILHYVLEADMPFWLGPIYLSFPTDSVSPVIFKRLLSISRWGMCTCFLLHFIVLTLMFKSLIHFELILHSMWSRQPTSFFFINFLVFILYASVLGLHISMCTIKVEVFCFGCLFPNTQ